jgi:hypothetical protein
MYRSTVKKIVETALDRTFNIGGTPTDEPSIRNIVTQYYSAGGFSATQASNLTNRLCSDLAKAVAEHVCSELACEDLVRNRDVMSVETKTIS